MFDCFLTHIVHIEQVHHNRYGTNDALVVNSSLQLLSSNFTLKSAQRSNTAYRSPSCPSSLKMKRNEVENNFICIYSLISNQLSHNLRCASDQEFFNMNSSRDEYEVLNSVHTSDSCLGHRHSFKEYSIFIFHNSSSLDLLED